MTKGFLEILILVVLMISCQNGDSVNINPIERLPDNEAGEVVKKAIDYAGGWDAWNSKKNFSFYKKITQLDSSGAVKKIVKQLHQYDLGDHFKARMTWIMDSSNFLIINNGEEAKKYKEGVELNDQKSKNEAWNSSFGSHYVIAMPYKLTDPGVRLTYEGIEEKVLDKPAHAVKVEYAENAGSTGGMHLWYYYFDKETYDLVGNYLDYGEGHSLTTYEVFEDVEGMRFHNKRYSYSSNEKKERVLLRTIYENEEMKFNQAFESDVFQLK